MANVIYAPAPFSLSAGTPSVFLAGSIDMGSAIDWQAQFAQQLQDLDVLILNPRRPDWDSSWRQSLDDPQFRTQVEWELSGLERASLVAMFFAPGSQAPVTLLELGLTAHSGRVVVCCPEGYWRKGNVDVVCRRFGIPQMASLDQLVATVRRRLVPFRVPGEPPLAPRSRPVES